MQKQGAAWTGLVGLIASLTVLPLGVTPPNPTTNLETNVSANAYTIQGIFVEGCSCAGSCPCELTGVVNGCHGVGAMQINTGTYQGTDLTGVKIAYATLTGQWVKVYVEGRDEQQKAAAAAFARDALKNDGEVKAVVDARVEVFGKGGDFLVAVNNGTILKMETEPVIGGDGLTPIGHTNTKNRLSPTLFQGKTRGARYEDGANSFSLEGSNAYFNENMAASGRM